MLVTLRGQRVKGILVSMSLGIPLISFGNMPSKHLFPSIVILLSASLTCKAKSLAQVVSTKTWNDLKPPQKFQQPPQKHLQSLANYQYLYIFLLPQQ